MRVAPSLERRQFLRAFGIGAALTALPPAINAKADNETNDEKRKARYKANSPEIQTFYRVNRYPS
jgi:hypothetical protein